MRKTQVTRALRTEVTAITRWIDDRPLTGGQAVALGGVESGSVTAAIVILESEPDGDRPLSSAMRGRRASEMASPCPMGEDESSQHPCHPHIRRRQAEQGGSQRHRWRDVAADPGENRGAVTGGLNGRDYHGGVHTAMPDGLRSRSSLDGQFS